MNISLITETAKGGKRSFKIKKKATTIGRGDDCELRLRLDGVSREHCQIQIVEGEAFIMDLGSTNGTLLNGKRVEGREELAHGDLLQVGDTIFKVADRDRREEAGSTCRVKLDDLKKEPASGTSQSDALGETGTSNYAFSESDDTDEDSDDNPFAGFEDDAEASASSFDSDGSTW